MFNDDGDEQGGAGCFGVAPLAFWLQSQPIWVGRASATRPPVPNDTSHTWPFWFGHLMDDSSLGPPGISYKSTDLHDHRHVMNLVN